MIMNRSQPVSRRTDEKQTHRVRPASYAASVTRKFRITILTVRRTLKGQESKAPRPA